MILFTIFTYFLVPETKNKTFEEIAHRYAPGDDIEVEEALDEDVFDDNPPPIPSPNPQDEADAKLVTINFENKQVVPSPNGQVKERRGSKGSRKSEEEVELLPQSNKCDNIV